MATLTDREKALKLSILEQTRDEEFVNAMIKEGLNMDGMPNGWGTSFEDRVNWTMRMSMRRGPEGLQKFLVALTHQFPGSLAAMVRILYKDVTDAQWVNAVGITCMNAAEARH